MRGVFLRLRNIYKAQIDKRPLIAQAVTAGTITTIGDLITQNIIEQKGKHDFKRTAIMSACGFFYFGPVCGAWLAALNRWKLPTLACVALDQGLFVFPVLSGFLTIQTLLNGKSVNAACNRVKSDLLPILKVNWMIWIPAQAVNFYAIPFQFRMLFLQVVAVFWNSYLSYKSNQSIEVSD